MQIYSTQIHLTPRFNGTFYVTDVQPLRAALGLPATDKVEKIADLENTLQNISQQHGVQARLSYERSQLVGDCRLVSIDQGRVFQEDDFPTPPPVGLRIELFVNMPGRDNNNPNVQQADVAIKDYFDRKGVPLN